ncbi:MAG: response regulator [Pseudomonadota bacterium]
MATIFWVEDQSHWIDKFKPVLENQDFDGKPTAVVTHRFANAARQQIALMKDQQRPDIALLDAHMNGNLGAGFSVSRTLLGKWPDLPIIYLSEHSGTQTEQQALEDMHAQDFIAKHQRNIEEVLCWRIRAILRQHKSNTGNSRDFLAQDHLRIDLASWEVFWRDQKLMNPLNPRRPLAPMPRKILYHLLKARPRPVNSLQMADYLQADPEKFSYASYRQHIKTLRHSIDQAEGGKGLFLAHCKQGKGIVTFGDEGAYCWK